MNKVASLPFHACDFPARTTRLAPKGHDCLARHCMSVLLLKKIIRTEHAAQGSPVRKPDLDAAPAMMAGWIR